MHRRWLVLWCVVWFAVPVQAQRVALDSVSVSDTSVRHVVQLRDGSTLIGRLTAVTTDSVRLRMAQGELSFARSMIAQVRQVAASQLRNGEYWFENPHYTRLLFSSTAIPLEQGTGYYSNAWLFVHAFAVGMTDRFTLGGGATTIPGLALTDNLFYLLPKYTIVNGDRTRLALGALIGFFPFNNDVNEDVTSGGLLYAVGTTGNRESNVSAGVAWGYVDGDITSNPGLMVGGQGRVSRRISLISENWFIPVDGRTEGVVSYGLRFLGENLSVDLAWISLLGSGDISAPWLGFAFRF
jgi:hypothetical protein